MPYKVAKGDFTIDLDRHWKLARQDRDRRLTACDWTQLPDTAIDDDTRAAWAAYRQKLRDVTSNNTDPTNIDWPAPPA